MIAVILSSVTVHAQICPAEVTACNYTSEGWNCSIQADQGIEVLRSVTKILEQDNIIAMLPQCSTEFLQFGTKKSPGAGRPDCDFSPAGISRLLKHPSNENRAIENIGYLFMKHQQENALKTLCKDENISWFDGSPNSFFARGHFVPSKDFTPMDYKEKTFHYFNAAPQWQPFNQGNWIKLENSVRRLVNGSPRPFKIITGVLDIMTCPKNNATQIYIQNERSSDDYVQVVIHIPMAFYKIIIPVDKSTEEKSILVVTINHPTMNKMQAEAYLHNKFCVQDICDDVVNPNNTHYKWFYHSKFNCTKGKNYTEFVSGGYTFACEFINMTPQPTELTSIITQQKIPIRFDETLLNNANVHRTTPVKSTSEERKPVSRTLEQTLLSIFTLGISDIVSIITQE